MVEGAARESMQEGLSSGNGSSEARSNGSQSPRNAEGLQSAMEMLLESHGLADEQIDEVLAQLNVLVAEPPNGSAVANGSTNGNDTSSAGAMLSENARIILAQRYLMKDDDGEPVEDPDGLFHRVCERCGAGREAGSAPYMGRALLRS